MVEAKRLGDEQTMWISQEEIKLGIENVMSTFGLSSIAKMFLMDI